MINFSIIIPIFNESNNIFRLVEEIIHQKFDENKYEIIIVNDSSTDDFKQKLINFKLNSKINVIHLNKQQGQSNAIAVGIKNSKYDNIITMDGDGQNNPNDINKLVNIYQNDLSISLVSGIRKNRKDNLSKIISSRIANKVRMLYLKDKCIDTGCSLKIFKKIIFNKFEFFDGIHRFIPSLYEGTGHKVAYVYVSHRKRLYGKSKYDNFKRLYRGIIDMIKVKKQIKKFE